MNNSHENRRLYPKFWNTDYVLLIKIRDSLNQAMTKHLSGNKQQITALDFGCGDIPYKPIITPYVDKYIACDLENNDKADIVTDLESKVPLPDSSIDLVLSIQVLEHVLNVDSYLMECNRVLRDDALLILSTHGWWTHHPYPHDLRRWTFEGLKYELNRFGFEVIDNYWMIGMLAYSSQLRVQCFKGLLEKKGRLAGFMLNMISSYYQLSMLIMDKIIPENIAINNSANYLLVARKIR